jgi:hypothetical protein
MINVDLLNELGSEIYDTDEEDREHINTDIDRLRDTHGVSYPMLLLLDKLQKVVNSWEEEEVE